jgi:hypothetical protein
VPKAFASIGIGKVSLLFKELIAAKVIAELIVLRGVKKMKKASIKLKYFSHLSALVVCGLQLKRA